MTIHTVKIKTIGHITRDTLQIFTERPQGLDFTPGQAIDISINKEGWVNETRPFTFTSLPDDDYLQFTIKTYPLKVSSFMTGAALEIDGVYLMQ